WRQRGEPARNLHVKHIRAVCAAAAIAGALAPAYGQIAAPVATVPGMPGVPDPANLYSETAAGKLSAAVAGHLERIYVPNHGDNTVSVIDPATLRAVDRSAVAVNPQRIVPSWNLQVLWVAN